MSGVSLPPLDLTLNKPFFHPPARPSSKAKRRDAPVFSTEQISLLLSLLAIGIYQKAEAQGTEADLVITTQNNFGEVTQLILSGGKLYILTGGCELQFVRIATPADLAAITALSPLSLPEAGLEVYLISAAQMEGTDASAYCLNSDPVSEFVDQIRHQDEGAVSLTGMLAAGLGLLAGLGGGFGGGGGGGQARDQSGLTVSDIGASNEAVSVSTNFADNSSYISLNEGTYDDESGLNTGIRVSATNSRGDAVTGLQVDDNRFEIRDGTLFIVAGASFNHEDEGLDDVSIRTSSSPFAPSRTEQGFTITITGDGGFQQSLDIVIADEDDYPVALSLTAEDGVAGADRFEIELDDGERAADIITDFTTADDRLLLVNPDNTRDITNYGSLADLLDEASLRLEADTTDTEDLNVIYNPDPDNQADQIVLVLDEFLADNDLTDLTLDQIELL